MKMRQIMFTALSKLVYLIRLVMISLKNHLDYLININTRKCKNFMMLKFEKVLKKFNLQKPLLLIINTSSLI